MSRGPGIRARGAAAALGVLVLGAALGAAPAPAAELGFVHVEGNVGGASGGHVALRREDRVWHLRVGPDGLLRLEREGWEEFVFRYAVLGNRPLHVARVEVDDAAAERVDRALRRGWVAELEQRDVLDDRVLDLALLEALRGASDGVPVPGAGLFAAEGAGAAGATVLRRRAEAALAPDGLDAALARVGEALAAPPADAPGARLAYREALAEREALRVLREGRPLADEAWVDPAQAGAPLPLDAPARRALRARADALADEVAALLTSPRPDRGEALLVLVARHRALARSLREGRLRTLDALPDGPPVLDARAARRRHAELSAVGATLAERLREVWAEALSDGRLDAEEARVLEDLASRAVEATRAAAGAPLRAAPPDPIPSRARALAPPASARLLPDAASAAHEDALRAREAAARRVAEGRGYQLVLRNCATELVRTLDDALGGAEAAAQALGGSLEPGEAGSFVPFVLHDLVRARLRYAGELDVPSWRQRRLAALYAAEPDALVFLRESNVWTSTLYERRDRDGSFVFFTDDAVWPRPLFGLVNLGYGLADALVGVVTAPFDGGHRLLRAGRGMLFSAPELVFANVRKGSYDAASLPSDALAQASDAAAAPTSPR